MDFYAMQLTPRKKKDDKEKREEQIKKFREHVITKEELLADIEPKNEKRNELKADIVKDVSAPAPVEIAGPTEVAEPLEIDRKIEIPKAEEEVRKIEKEVFTVMQNAGKTKQEDISENVEEKIVKDFAEGILADDQKRIENAMDSLIQYRSKDINRLGDDNELNVKLKEKLVGTIPALFAYKGGRSVLLALQILDEINIKFTAKDLIKLPDEILKADDMKRICERYLIWFAKEYPDSPGLLQDRIYYFNKCGILSYQEIKGFSGLQLAVNSDLVNFIKANLQNPHDVERKIYEFALAGLVDDKKFKKESKVKSIVKKFISTLVTTKKDKPLEVSRKIGEYERIGLIGASEILEDDKIEKMIEKYLLKFRKEHRDHPRKVSALIKDYFNAGLIDKKMRDRLMQ